MLKKYFSLVVLLMSFPVVLYAATPEQCAMLKKINASIVCDSSTPITDIDKGLGFTGDVSAAKDYLFSIAQGLPGTKADPKCSGQSRKNIERLDNKFALCAANFLRAFEANYGIKVTLRSAFRPPQDLGDGCGSNAAAGGANGSNHMKGLAMDVNPNGDQYEKIWDFARKNPSFGVCFPYLSGDRPHMALAGTGTGEASKCASQGVTQACSGAASVAGQYETPQGDDKQFYQQHSQPNTEDIAEGLQRTEAQNGVSGDAGGSPAGTTAGSNPLSNAIQQALSSPAQQSTTPESNTTSNAFKCLFAAFGSDAEGCADTQARALLGDELGVTDTVGATGEDSAVGSSGNDTLSNAAVCSDSGSSISRSDTGCLQVGGQGGADNNVPAISTGSVTQTIKDSAVTDSVGAPGPVAKKFISLGQMFDWPSAAGSQASQYDGQLFYAGDLPNGLYYDSYTDTVRYESSGREVSPAVLKVLMSEDTASPTSTQSVSWLGVTGSLVRGALPVLGFTFPLASFFSF